jgi:hypothetical protein
MIASGRMPEQLIADGARQIEADAQQRAQSWISTVRSAAAVEEWDLTPNLERKVVRKVAHQFFETFGPELSI